MCFKNNIFIKDFKICVLTSAHFYWTSHLWCASINMARNPKHIALSLLKQLIAYLLFFLFYLRRTSTFEETFWNEIFSELSKDCKTRQKHKGLVMAMCVEDGDLDISSQMTDVFYINFIGIDQSQYLLRNKQYRNSTGQKVLSSLWSFSFHPPLGKNATEYAFCPCGLPKGPHTTDSCIARAIL